MTGDREQAYRRRDRLMPVLPDHAGLSLATGHFIRILDPDFPGEAPS